MTDVPGDFFINAVIQDKAGFRANVRINVGYAPNWLASALEIGDVQTLIYSGGASADVITAIQNLTNAKVVRVSWGIDSDYAAEPSSESGNYQFVTSKASTLWEDGKGAKERMLIPAPINGIFLPGVGMQTVVDPTNTTVLALAEAVQALDIPTPKSGIWGDQFFGGQLVQGKARRRRVNQGQ